MLEVQAVAF